MNKKLLEKLLKRNRQSLQARQGQIEAGEIREEELDAVNAEVDELIAEGEELADQLASVDDDQDPTEEQEENTEEVEDGAEEQENERAGMLTQEQRDRLSANIGNSLAYRGRQSDQRTQQVVRKAFADFIVGNIEAAEARQLGIESGNGSVTIPDFLSREIITYSQEENVMRRLGTNVATKENIKYPVLVKKATAQGHKKERTNNEIPETTIEFDEIELSPTEFDALATVTKKLLARTGLPIEQIVMDELKKAYVEKEIQYMIHGDEPDNINPGALSKKAVEFQTTETDLYNALVKMKNNVKKVVRKKARWVLNTAALTKIETMKTEDGLPLLRPFTQAEGGIGYTLLGYRVEEEDAISEAANPDKAIFYFGDFSKFYIQDVIGSLEVQKLIELFAKTNRIGFRIWALLDAQLIYSPFEIPVYKYSPVDAAVGG